MSQKIRIAIIFGGRSAEHEVSLQSAKNIIDALDRDKYETILIKIEKSGKWLMCAAGHPELDSVSLSLSSSAKAGDPSGKSINWIPVCVGMTPAILCKELVERKQGDSLNQQIDMVFPVLHGPFGEDGTIQGLLKLANIPFVGAGVLGSAIGMDKDVMKRLLQAANIPVAKLRVFRSPIDADFTEITQELGLPFFLKPANLGSSVGVHKVHNENEFKAAIKDAFSYDTKVIVEENISGREIECSVLGDEKPIASVPGEVKPTHEFYDYEAKYIDENGALLEIPAKLRDSQIKQIQDLAVQTFKTLECSGMARVDFFLSEDGRILVNEINTIPGFTKISMYPKLWEKSGMSYSELINRLVELALKRYQREQKLKISK